MLSVVRTASQSCCQLWKYYGNVETMQEEAIKIGCCKAVCVVQHLTWQPHILVPGVFVSVLGFHCTLSHSIRMNTQVGACLLSQGNEPIVLCLAVEIPWSAPGGPFLTSFARAGLENTCIGAPFLVL